MKSNFLPLRSRSRMRDEEADSPATLYAEVNTKTFRYARKRDMYLPLPWGEGGVRGNRTTRNLILFLYACSLLILPPASAPAQPHSGLLPPRGEIGPSFWEQRGWLVILVTFFIVLALTALLIVFTRPKKNQTEPPEIAARRALQAWQNRPADGTLLMEVSRIFRRYIVFAFNLPPDELTTAELSRALQSLPQAEPALAAEIGDFLRQCDEDKFSPLAIPPRGDVATRALALLEKIEMRRHQLSEKPTAA